MHSCATWIAHLHVQTIAACLRTLVHSPTAPALCPPHADVLQAAAADEAKAAQLTWPLRVRMALDAARGLLYLHRHSPPIIHRDVKSPNLASLAACGVQ